MDYVARMHSSGESSTTQAQLKIIRERVHHPGTRSLEDRVGMLNSFYSNSSHGTIVGLLERSAKHLSA